MAKKKIKSQQKIIIASILVLFFLAGIGLSVWYKKQSASTQSGQGSAGKVLRKTASLVLTTKDKKVARDESFTVKLVLDSGNQGVEAADFIVSFDPQFLQVRTLTPGNYFKTYPIKKTEGNTVKISGVAYFDGQSIIVPKGKGEVAEITFTAVSTIASTSITIDREKTVVASDGQNILNLSRITDLKIMVK